MNNTENPINHQTAYSATEDDPIILHQNRFFKMIFNGRFHYLEAVKYSQGVVVIPLVNKEKYILVSQLRVPSLGISLEFPRGGVDANESKEQAVLRELKEETGAISVSSLKYLGDIYSESATINGAISIFFVELDSFEDYKQEDSNEIETIVLLTEKELLEKIKSGALKDGITCAAYTLLKAHLVAK